MRWFATPGEWHCGFDGEYAGAAAGERILCVTGWGRKESAEVEGALVPARVRCMSDCSSDILLEEDAAARIAVTGGR